MYVTSVPNRGSPPAVLLRESYRDEGKVKTRTLANLSHWPERKVETLKRALKGLPPAIELSEAFEITRSLPHGHVAAVLGSAQHLGMQELIDAAPSRKRDLVTAMLVAHVIGPGRSNDGWAKWKTLYFVIECSQPFKSIGLEVDGTPLPPGQTEAKGKNIRAHLDYRDFRRRANCFARRPFAHQRRGREEKFADGNFRLGF